MKKFIIASTIFAAMAGFAFAQDAAASTPKTPYEKLNEAGKVQWYNCTWFKNTFMTEPTSEMIKIDTIPSGAEVVFDGRVAGTTPIVLEYPRKKAPKVVLKKDGYPAAQIRIKRSLNRTAYFSGAWNLLALPWLVTWQDLAYDIGSLLKYSETDVIVELPKSFEDGPLCPEAYNGNVELRAWIK